jgi:vacuolar protein 8
MGRITDVEIAESGGLREYAKQLIDKISSGTSEIKERALATLWSLATQNTQNPPAIRQLESIPALVGVLQHGTPVAQERAAGALACIMSGDTEYQTKVIEAGALLPLGLLLRSGGCGGQEQAAAAFASLSELRDAHEAIIKTKSVQALIGLLQKGSSAAQVNAAQAIANLCTGNPTSQAEVQQFGGIKGLLQILGSGKAQEHAARAISCVAHRNGIVQAEVCQGDGVAKLLSMLSDRNIESQIQAAAALGVLAQGEDGLGQRRTQNAISKAGGIGPLLAMMNAVPVVHEAVAESVKAIAEVARRNRANQDQIAQMGGIKPLVELVQQGNAPDFVQQNAALALTEICRRNEPNQTAVQDLGGIGQLVVLLKNSGKSSVEAEVAGALWTISVNHAANKVSIASAGAIATLCGLLASPNERAQSHASSALASLAFENVENQKQESPLLVGLLASKDEKTQKLAAKALWRMIKENPDSHTIIAKAGGAEASVKLLRDGSPTARKYALWSLSLAIDKESQETVSVTGGVKPLVASLSSSNVTVAEQASAALAKLAEANKKTQKEIASAGGIAPLIALIDLNASDVCQQHAAAALAELALLRANKTAIDRAGGISPLVSLLLCDGSKSAKQYAASALARLSTDGSVTDARLQAQASAPAARAAVAAGAAAAADEGAEVANSGELSKAEQIAQAGAITPLVSLLSGDNGPEAQEEAAGALLALAGKSTNRVAITESGGIGPLVQLLGCDNPIARQHAEGALVRLSIESGNRVLIIEQLVGMLVGGMGVAAQEQAAAALANLARDSTDNRKSIVDSGGIAPLLELLESPSSKAKENAASAVTALCATRENQDAIARCGGIAKLVNVLANSSNKEVSGSTLCGLAAMAIWQLAKKNPANQLLVVEAGAIAPLVGMLGSTSAELQSNAAGALSCIARNQQDNQVAIARTGAIAPLCTLVREGSIETKEMCASALWALSTENQANKATIAKLGGVEPLVGLLVSGTTIKSQEYATGALSSLASKNAENRSAIAKRLVGLLNGRAPERAVKVLHALANLARGNNANQMAIVKAGGVLPIIGWVSNSNEEAQREAAHAVLSMATNNATTQTLVARCGGISPLIALVASSPVLTQEYAARALWHIASSHESQQLILEAGGIPPLVAMLSAEGIHAAELAALTIVRLADNNPQVSEAISNVGGIVPLVKLLGVGSAEAQQQAASAIAEIALVAQNRDAIAHAGGIPPLIALLSDRTEGTPECAARALANIAQNNSGRAEEEGNEEDGDDAFEDEAIKEPALLQNSAAVETRAPAAEAPSKRKNATFLGGPGRRAMINKGGGIKKLISMLDGTDRGDTPVSRKSSWVAAGRVMIFLAKQQSAVSSVPKEDETKADDAMFSASRNSKVILGSEAQAAAALCAMAYGDEDMQDAIIAANGVPPLVQLMRHASSPLGQEHAARAIWYLCSSIHNQTEVVEKGCIPELVALSKQGTPATQEVAAAGIAELAAGSIAVRERRRAEALERAEQRAEERRKRRKRNAEEERRKRKAEEECRAEASGMQETVSRSATPLSGDSADGHVLSDEDDDVDEEEWMAGDRLTMIVKAGAITAMVNLLTSGTPLAKEKAAASLWHFAIDSQSQAAIAKANGIGPIVLLLDNATKEAGIMAARSLARLSQESADMQSQIAKRLVMLMNSDNTGAQERAARALYELAKDQPSSPEVIVNAGAISPLLNLLSYGTTDGKKESSSALASLAKNNPKNQLAICIGLVDLLGKGEDDAQEQVTKLLLDLANDKECRIAIAKAGAIPRLIVQLKGVSVRVHEYACAVLAHLIADHPENVTQCTDHGGMKPIVALLKSESITAQASAAKVLADMTRTSLTNQAVAVHEGGIALLVTLLRTGLNAPTGYKWVQVGSQKPELGSELIHKALSKALEEKVDFSRDELDKLKLHGLPQSSFIKVGESYYRPADKNAQAEAAGALWSLATGLATTQAAVAEAGAIVPLVQLLSVDDTACQIKASGALAALANGSLTNQNGIRDAGGVGPLVGMLDAQRLRTVQAHAAEALAELTRGPDGLRWELVSSTRPEEGHEINHAQLTEALATNAKDGSPRVFTAEEFKAFGGLTFQMSDYVEIQSVTRGEYWPTVPEVITISYYRAKSGHSENQRAVADAGAVKPLIAMLLKEGSEGAELKAKEAAAGALWSMCSCNFGIQNAVADEGGIAPLVMLLGSSSNTAQKQAAGALASLALNNNVNETKISVMMIELLTNSVADDSPLYAAEKAARAVSRLARAHSSNQYALKRAGGIQKLIEMADDGKKSKDFLKRKSDELNAAAEASTAAMKEMHFKFSKQSGLDVKMTAAQAFSTIDKDCDGSISVTEIMATLHKDTLEEVSEADIRSICDRVDQSGDGDLQIQEFTLLWKIIQSFFKKPPKPYSAPAQALSAADQELLRPGQPLRASTQGTVWSGAAQSEIAGALWSMADKNVENQIAIADAGGISLLIRMISPQGDSTVQRNAAGALWSLAQLPANQILITQENGIAHLVELLKKGGTGGSGMKRTQETAAGALHTLATLESNRIVIAEANAIVPLVALFEGGTDAAKAQAAGALSVLVVNNEANQIAIADELVKMLIESQSIETQAQVTSLVHTLSLDPDNRGALANAGAVSQLVKQLQTGSDETQSLAANALSQLALKSTMLRGRVTQELVKLLGDDSDEVRKRAGIALRDMAADGGDESQKPSINGLGPLVTLLKDGLRDGRVEAQEYALWSLSLATDQACRERIVELGCLWPAISSLNSGLLSRASEEHAATVISGAARETENAREIIKHGAIPLLVKLLGEESSTGAKKNAALALARLAKSGPETQLAIAKSGAVTALTQWLTNDSLGPGMCELAARSLADIADNVPQTTEAVSKADAIGPLIAMLGPSRGNDSQKSAAGALATLAKVELPPLPLKGKVRRKNEEEALLEDDSDSSEGEPAPVLPRFAPIAELGGIPILVDLLKAERTGPHENATEAIWRLAGIGDNKLAIADVGGIPALVNLLSIGSVATQRFSAAAMSNLARDCPQNQLKLAKAKAILPLVQLLGAESVETQDFAVSALLSLASHPESRNAVVKRLVAVLDSRNSAAQLRAAGALAVLSSRNLTYRSAIMEAGAIPPLVRILGDGLRVEKDTPQERAAYVLADLARSSESKEEIVESEGITPLVRMLSSPSQKAQNAAAAAIHLLSSNGDNKISIAQAGGIPRLVALIAAKENADGQAYAAAALRLLSTSPENKVEIISNGGIPYLVQMMISDMTSAEAMESAAGVLSEIARMPHPSKLAIVNAGGIAPLVRACKEGSSGAKKGSAAALWGLSQSAEFKDAIIAAGAVPPLVALLMQSGEAQSFSVAALNMLAEKSEAKKSIFLSCGVEPLMEIAKNITGSWLRGQAVEVLGHLGIKDPFASSTITFDAAPLSPRTPRAGAASARGKGEAEEPKQSVSVLTAGVEPPNVSEAFMTMATGELWVVSGTKPLQLRAKFELDSDKAGELDLKSVVHIHEQKMTEDGKTRMCVSSEAETIVLGWLTGSTVDGTKNLKSIGRPVLQVVASKPLVARVSADLTSDKAGELQPDSYIVVLESRKMTDGSHRIGYAVEGKEMIEAWITGITNKGDRNVEIIPGRRAAILKSQPEVEKRKEVKPKEDRAKVSKAPKLKEEPADEPAIDKQPSPTTTDKKEKSEKLLQNSKVELQESKPDDRSKSAEKEGQKKELDTKSAQNMHDSSSEIGKKEQAEKSSSRSRKSVGESQANQPTTTEGSSSPKEKQSRRSSTGPDSALLSLDPSAREKQPPSDKLAAPQKSARKSLGSESAKAIALATAGTWRAEIEAAKVAPTPKANPLATAVTDTSVFTVRNKLKMRTDAELNSDQAGEVRAGTRVHILEQRILADGTVRARLALEGQTAALGWASTVNKADGQNTLEPVSQAPLPPASSQRPAQKALEPVSQAPMPPASSQRPAQKALEPVSQAPMSPASSQRPAQKALEPVSQAPMPAASSQRPAQKALEPVSQAPMPTASSQRPAQKALEPVSQAPMSPASSQRPPQKAVSGFALSKILTGSAPPLEPETIFEKGISGTLPIPSGNLPTARSSAKANAAVGVVKSSLPPAAIAAAEAAARDAVAAQAAAIKEAAEAARAARPKPLTGSPAPALALIAAEKVLQEPGKASGMISATASTKSASSSSGSVASGTISASASIKSASASGSFHVVSPKGVISARMNSPRSASPRGSNTPSTPGSAKTPGSSSTPRRASQGAPSRPSDSFTQSKR